MILDFIYQGEVSVSQEGLESFLAITAELKIKGLVNKDGSKIGKGAATPKEVFDLDIATSKTGDDEISMIEPFSTYNDIYGSSTKKATTRSAKKSTYNYQSAVESETEFFVAPSQEDDISWKLFEDKEKSSSKKSKSKKKTSFKDELDTKDDFGLAEETKAPMDTFEDLAKLDQGTRTSTRQKRSVKLNLKEEEEDWSADSPKPKRGRRKSIKVEEEEPKEPKRKSLAPELLELIERLDEGKCRCIECDKVFNSYVGIRQHLDVKHNEDAEVYQCSLCKENDKETIVKSKQKFRIHLSYGHEMKGRNILDTYGILLSKEDLVAYKQKLEAMKLELEGTKN